MKAAIYESPVIGAFLSGGVEEQDAGVCRSDWSWKSDVEKWGFGALFMDAAELGFDHVYACKEALQIVDMPSEGIKRQLRPQAKAFAHAAV